MFKKKFDEETRRRISGEHVVLDLHELFEEFSVKRQMDPDELQRLAGLEKQSIVEYARLIEHMLAGLPEDKRLAAECVVGARISNDLFFLLFSFKRVLLESR